MALWELNTLTVEKQPKSMYYIKTPILVCDLMAAAPFSMLDCHSHTTLPSSGQIGGQVKLGRSIPEEFNGCK